MSLIKLNDSSDDENISDDEILNEPKEKKNVLQDDDIDIERSTPVFRQTTSSCITSKYESLDYEVCDNELYQTDHRYRETHSATRKDFSRWIVFIFIGILTGLVASFIDIVIEYFSLKKFRFLQKSVNTNVINGDLFIPYLYFALMNIIPVAIGSALVSFVEPVAAGSGVPLIKSYLNGVKVPRVVRIKTLLVKVAGVILSVIGGLAGGKEGPMIQTGSVIAAGISQGKSTTFRSDLGIFRDLRDDHEKRDFVVGGASAGVAAAFGAPIGGVLFSLEEACSFWNPNLILRTLVASIISSFTLNLVLSARHGLNSFQYPGLFNLGRFEELPYEYFEIPIFVLMGCLGGLLGACWNHVNINLFKFRLKYIRNGYVKTLEAALISLLTATVACIMFYSISDCRPLGVDPTEYPVQLFCKDDEYDAGVALWFQTPEASLKALFHDPPAAHRFTTLIVFVLIYWTISCITYGLSVSLGIFIPTLLIGAAWGRLLSMTMKLAFPLWTFIHPSKYALIGAAAQLGGVMRMTISLTAILIETTGNITFALPLIITFIAAKWTGDLFNEGIYDTQISVSGVPMLHWRVKRSKRCLKSIHIMSTPPVCIRLREKVGVIIEILKKTTHNGFPIIDDYDEDGTPGNLLGLMLRSQLTVIIKHRLYEEFQQQWKPDISIEVFRNEYPRYPLIQNIPVSIKELNNTINSKMFMNRSAHSAWQDAAVPKIFETFRALGLRHLVVVNNENKVKGIITRKDFL